MDSVDSRNLLMCSFFFGESKKAVIIQCGKFV